MNVFSRISKEEAVNLKMPLLFSEVDERLNKNYGKISDETYNFIFSWYSDIEPIVLEINPNIYSVGVDQHFAIVDFNSNAVLLNLNLFYNFYDTKIINEYFLVITELEIIKVDRITFKILSKFELPDFFNGLEFENGVLEVTCVGGEIVIIK
jgi:hypothetical protein